jgi:PKD repeat protein
MRGWLAVGLVCVLFLSGCAQKSSSSSSSSGSSATKADFSAAGNGTGKAASAAGHAPTALLNASALTGAAPLAVNFTLAGTDLDGDALSWKLDLGDNSTANGTALPSTVAHNFTLPGLHLVRLVVSDGKLLANATLTVNVTAGGPPHGVPAALTFTGTVSSAGGADAADHPFELALMPSKMVVTLKWGPVAGLGDLDLALNGPEGAVDTSESFNTPAGTPLTSTTESITVTDAKVLSQMGTWSLHVSCFLGAQVSYTATVTFE